MTQPCFSPMKNECKTMTSVVSDRLIFLLNMGQEKSLVALPAMGISPLHPHSVQAPMWPYNFGTAACTEVTS